MKGALIGAAIALLASPACGSAQSGPDLVPALERLAKANNAEAIYHLGMAYQTGAGLPRDPAKALDAFRRAAALGDVLASYKLGCFYDGQGQGLVEADADVALRHKLVAAEAGYALAQQDVAALYARKGETDTAVKWLEKAALQGWPGALSGYASVHNGAPGVTPDPVKTAAYFRLFLAGAEASEGQRQWLEKFEQRMSPEQRRRAADTVRAYRSTPTPLTIKALSGQRAAIALVARTR